MVGLSVILENYKDVSANNSAQVIRKGSMVKPPSSNPSSPTTPTPPSPYGFSRRRNNESDLSSYCGFLDHCFLCKQKLLPGKDIYMYKGDRAFCSVDCRYRQIFTDEEETAAKAGCTIEYNCSLTATSSASSSSTRSGKRANNAFAY